MLFHSGNKHGDFFRDILGEFVALKQSVQLFEIVVNGLVQLIYIRKLITQTCVIS